MFAVACTKAAPAADPTQPTTTTAAAPAVAAPTAAPDPVMAAPAKPMTKKDQPPHVKLKLGHYSNSKRGIGLVIDLYSARTENVADIDPARVKFDGDSKVYQLNGQHGGRGRIDFLNGKSVMLHAYEDGNMSVYVPDPEGGAANNDEIHVSRDGDADPL